MEFKKGDKTVNVPVLGFIAGATMIVLVTTEICKVAIAKKEQIIVQEKGLSQIG